MKFRSDIPEGGGSKNYLKLKDKESAIGIFRGELHEYAVLWEGQKSSVVAEGTPGAKFRFKVNFVIKDGASYVPKIFEQGLTVYKQLAELHAEYDLETTVIKVTRNGTGTDTTYSLLPLLKQTLSKEVLKHLGTLELHALEQAPAGEPAAKADESEPPF